MVNYDKWDKLEVSDDEEDTASRRATVTRLDAPSRVTFGGDVGKNVIEVARASAGVGAANETADVVTPGAAAAPARSPSASHGTDYARFDAIARHLSDDDEEAREYYEDEAWALAHPRPASDDAGGADERRECETSGRATTLETRDEEAVRDARTASFVANGGVDARAPGADAASDKSLMNLIRRDDASTRNDDSNDIECDSKTRLMWSQTKEEVIMSVVVPPGTRASDVVVRCASDQIEVAVKTKTTHENDAEKKLATFLSDAWTHPIDPEPSFGDDDDDDDVPVFGDWEVCDWEPGGRRVVRVTARKKTIGGSLVHWWRSGTKRGATIDVSAVAGRAAGAGESARRVWDEATEAFKKKIKDREKITIDV